VVYGGELGDPVAPTMTDSKMAFETSGETAKAMFESIGPDRRDTCMSDQQMRVRMLDDNKLVCIKSVEDYACYFGFDLKTGKSIGGSIC
jgi:hypothetical protein